MICPVSGRTCPTWRWLGVDALWLSPFYPSPMADFGYDVSDYCGVDPLFGTMDDFDGLLADAHELGMRVHHRLGAQPHVRRAPLVRRRSCSAGRARTGIGTSGATRSADGRPPNNWVSTFDLSAPAWTLDEATDQWYLHLFEPSQTGPQLARAGGRGGHARRAAVLAGPRGGRVPGRCDHLHRKGPRPRRRPEERVGIPHCIFVDEPATHEYLRSIRKLVDSYGDRLMLGEVFFFSTEAVAPYYGSGDELHLCFNFPPLFTAWNSSAWSECLRKTFRALDPRHAWPTWVLSNHDNPRARTRYDFGAALGGESEEERERRSEARARAAAVLLLTLRGTPFVYQGEELGLLDAVVGEDQVVDPGGRDGCRAPLPWDDSDDHGWPTDQPAGPWLPFPPDPAARNYATLRRDPDSILHLYRRLLAVRRATPALVAGEQTALELPDGLLGYRRNAGQVALHGADQLHRTTGRDRREGRFGHLGGLEDRGLERRRGRGRTVHRSARSRSSSGHRRVRRTGRPARPVRTSSPASSPTRPNRRATSSAHLRGRFSGRNRPVFRATDPDRCSARRRSDATAARPAMSTRRGRNPRRTTRRVGSSFARETGRSSLFVPCPLPRLGCTLKIGITEAEL